MARARAWFLPPSPEAGPRAALVWVRRSEIACGVVALALGLFTWSQGWWHWVLIGSGLLSVSPWPGAQQILRRAERDPGVLNHDRTRGYHRARRFVLISVPLIAVGTGALGYAYGRWLGAAINVVLTGGGGALGGWMALRGLRPPADDG